MINELKAKLLELRKARSHLAPSLAFTNAQIERIGKDKGNRATTEDEAIKFVQKLVETLEGNLALKYVDDVAAEIAVYRSLLPKMVTRSELETFVATLPDKNVGPAMKEIRAKYGSLVDMKMAKEILEAA